MKNYKHEALLKLLNYCEREEYIGYGKFDALNSPFLKTYRLMIQKLELYLLKL